jgi:hypothetical protein
MVNVRSITKLFVPIAVICTAMHACGTLDDRFSLSEYESVEYNGSIRLSLAHPYQSSEDDYEILVAAAPEAAFLGLCVDDETPNCQKDAPGYFAAKASYATTTKMFFKTEESALLEDGLVLNILAHDKQGALIDQRKVKFERITPKPAGGVTTAGGPKPDATTTTGTTPSTTTAPPSTTTTTTAAADDSRIKSIVNANCGGGACHPGYAANPASLKGTSAASLVNSGQMPKGRSMSASDKKVLMDYFAAQ